MSKQALLDQIRADIIENNVCPNLAKTATQLVFGDGDAEADIVFIGEAPGKKEDELGLPFVGASGKFLSEMLASIHLKRSQVYITNIVKYRPPANRDPLPEEKAAFLPYLQRQLEVIKPPSSVISKKSPWASKDFNSLIKLCATIFGEVFKIFDNRRAIFVE
jgi:DNA polymerase